METDIWSIPNVLDIIQKAQAAVLKADPNLAESDIAIRFMWSDDWDWFNATAETANTYVQTFAGTTNTFRISKVDKHLAVILIGVLLGNLGNLLNSIQIVIGQKTVREYPGTLITSQLNGIFLFADPIFTLEKKRVDFIFYNTAGPAVCSTFPYGLVIIPAGA